MSLWGYSYSNFHKYQKKNNHFDLFTLESSVVLTFVVLFCGSGALPLSSQPDVTGPASVSHALLLIHQVAGTKPHALPEQCALVPNVEPHPTPLLLQDWDPSKLSWYSLVALVAVVIWRVWLSLFSRLIFLAANDYWKKCF